MRRPPARRLALAVALLLAGGPLAAQDADLDALRLADTVPDEVQAPSDWRRFIEAGLGRSLRRGDDQASDTRRLSLDIQYDHALAPDWRVVLANRLDLAHPALRGSEHAINTLKEAYLNWRPGPDTLLDLGRINVRNGVATGYNPTDYFRVGALRSIVSINPASLRENRQGSVMLRGQRLWDGGAVTALFSPDLGHAQNPEGLSADLAATNLRRRGLVSLSQKLGNALTPQFLVYQEDSRAPQFGLNLTGLLNDATVVHLEWSGGRSASLLAQALTPDPGGESWRNRVATGLTWTSTNKISLTAELHFNGGGLDASAWDALRQGSPVVYGQYRNWLQTTQELPTRHALFFHGVWQDALTPRLDLSAMHHMDRDDASRRTWLEARYHDGPFEYSAQWQHNRGAPLSTFGAMPDARSWQAALRYYF